MPVPSPSHRSAVSRRGTQLAAATALGILVAALVLGLIALGLYEAHRQGPSRWVHSQYAVHNG